MRLQLNLHRFAGMTECCTCHRAGFAHRLCWVLGGVFLLCLCVVFFKNSLRSHTHGYLLGKSIADKRGSGNGGAPEEVCL